MNESPTNRPCGKNNTGVEAALRYGVRNTKLIGKKQVFLPMPSLGPIIMINQSKIIILFCMSCIRFDFLGHQMAKILPPTK
jgi:hypothetical protein